MKRLIEKGKESYDLTKEPDWQDQRRWKVLLREYRNGSILDVGCFNSKVPELIKTPNLYTGIDVLHSSLEKMQEQYPGAYYEFGSAYNLPSFPYSYVVLGEILEHLEYPALAVKKAMNALLPGGVLAISVPLEEANEPGAVDKNAHIWSFNKEDIQKLVASYSSKVKFKILGSQWFPYKYCWPQLICWVWKN